MFKKDIIIYSILMTLAVLPLVPLTLKYSQWNVDISRQILTTATQDSTNNFLFVLRPIFQYHLTMPVLGLSLISICIFLYRRGKREISFFLWITTFFIFSVLFGAPTQRHTVYWIPAFCILSTAVINIFNNKTWHIITALVLIFTSTYQFAVAYNREPEYAYGYEEAAKYITDNWKGDSVLYCSKWDTGIFIFFVRKHNNNQNRIVLRANKLLATSAMHYLIEDRIKSRNEIDKLIDKFGVSYVIITDRYFREKSFRWLKEEVESDKYILRKTIPLKTTHWHEKDMPLKIYERKKSSKAQTDAVIQMKIPLMGDTIRVQIKDLI